MSEIGNVDQSAYSSPHPRGARIQALIKLHGEKIDWEAFKGNAIDLGTNISPDDFILKMHPNAATCASLKYPRGRLLQLRGVVKDNELRHPTMLDADGEKHGIHETSMELAIHPYGPGFIMADGKGRIVGLLAGGAGQTDPLFD
ncbi:uncharacterized protein EI90DRAFT_3136274 [Cantharellus anzutake]|uniref:uncharacterized protein n=1 Tax=Cantharellus anzutake TaxID=1750568 RepID=UPI001908EE57|nr:uncharacterized protein EI90DRAFT_3136274 [Cantharellus anzutake]KAF8314117.1 hypothetical protein EI90DRAFT_3136274 [Cantharellus anzutake]